MNENTRYLLKAHQEQISHIRTVRPSWVDEFEAAEFGSAEECEALAAEAPTMYLRGYLMGRAIELRLGRIREKALI